jgi:hypothetical protein
MGYSRTGSARSHVGEKVEADPEFTGDVYASLIPGRIVVVGDRTEDYTIGLFRGLEDIQWQGAPIFGQCDQTDLLGPKIEREAEPFCGRAEHGHSCVRDFRPYPVPGNTKIFIAVYLS